MASLNVRHIDPEGFLLDKEGKDYVLGGSLWFERIQKTCIFPICRVYFGTKKFITAISINCQKSTGVWCPAQETN